MPKFDRPHFHETLEDKAHRYLLALEEKKNELMREMSGVDKYTLQKLRSIMDDYYNAENKISELLLDCKKKLTVAGIEFLQELQHALLDEKLSFEKWAEETVAKLVEDSVDEEAVRLGIEELIAETGALRETANEALQLAIESVASAEAAKKEADESLKAMEAFCPEFDETGSTVSCYPYKGNPVSIVSAIEGDTPERVELTRRGGNLLPFPYSDGSEKTMNGVTYTVDDERWLIASGTTTSAGTGFALANIIPLSELPDEFYVCAEIEEMNNLCLRVSPVDDGGADVSTVTIAISPEQFPWKLFRADFPAETYGLKLIFYRRERETPLSAKVRAYITPFPNMPYEPYSREVFSEEIPEGEQRSGIVWNDIPLLDGVNTFTSSTGSTTIKGRTSPVYYRKQIEARLSALEAASVNV